jgi:hypothetical protein
MPRISVIVSAPAELADIWTAHTCEPKARLAYSSPAATPRRGVTFVLGLDAVLLLLL